MQTTGLSEKLAKLLDRQNQDEQLVYNNGQLPGQPQGGYSPQPYIQQPYGYGYGGPDMSQREQPPLSYYGQDQPSRISTGQQQNPNTANWNTFTSFVDSWIYGESDAPAFKKSETTSNRAKSAADHQSVFSHSPSKRGGLKKGPSAIFGKSSLAAVAEDKEGKIKAKGPPKSYIIHVPSLNTENFEDIVHAVVWRVGRSFGFQAFNVNPKTLENSSKTEYVPSSIFVASDHINSLLVRNGYVRRDVMSEDEKPYDRFAKAVFELHATIFKAYEEQWTKLVGLSWRTSNAHFILRNYAYNDPKAVNGLLAELSLYFLIYSEASSLRHTPEFMWFLFWCMNHSFVMIEHWHRDLPDPPKNARMHYLELRNMHQQCIREVQIILQLHPARVRPEDTGRMSTITQRLKEMLVPDEDLKIVADMVAYGDGSFYLDRVVTPVFYVMSYEIDHLSNLGVDVAHRLGYDDFNESACDANIVHDLIKALRVTPEQLAKATPNDAYQHLTNLGFEKHTAGEFDPQVASDFWRTKVFVKTYRERRSWAAVLRSYYRVYSFHLVLFHLIQSYAFVGFNSLGFEGWRLISSACLTMAWCKAFERVCNWFMTRDPPEPLSTTLGKVFSNKGRVKLGMGQGARAALAFDARGGKPGQETMNAYTFAAKRFMERRKHEVEGAPLWGWIGIIEWIFLAAFSTAWYIAQFIESPIKKYAYEWWWIYVVCYTSLHILHFLLTTRDGYIVSLSHALGLPEYFKANSSTPDPTCWLHDSMAIKWKLQIYNSLFWVLLLTMKIPFDYIIICYPAVLPVTQVFRRGWLSCVVNTNPQANWIYGYWGAPCPGGDWVLALARMVPFLLIFIMDTSLFYQVTITIYGICLGMFKLDLGVLTGWDEVVQEFYKAPFRWWSKVMSPLGNDNNLAFTRQSLYLVDPEKQGNGFNEYKNAVVSDGLMFKKAVLTPDEIFGLNASEEQHRRNANRAAKNAVDDPDYVEWELTKKAVAGTGLDAGGEGTALLASSTNNGMTKKALDKKGKDRASPVKKAISIGKNLLTALGQKREDREKELAKRLSKMDPAQAAKAVDAEANATGKSTASPEQVDATAASSGGIMSGRVFDKFKLTITGGKAKDNEMGDNAMTGNYQKLAAERARIAKEKAKAAQAKKIEEAKKKRQDEIANTSKAWSKASPLKSPLAKNPSAPDSLSEASGSKKEPSGEVDESTPLSPTLSDEDPDNGSSSVKPSEDTPSQRRSKKAADVAVISKRPQGLSAPLISKSSSQGKASASSSAPVDDLISSQYQSLATRRLGNQASGVGVRSMLQKMSQNPRGAPNASAAAAIASAQFGSRAASPARPGTNQGGGGFFRGLKNLISRKGPADGSMAMDTDRRALGEGSELDEEQKVLMEAALGNVLSGNPESFIGAAEEVRKMLEEEELREQDEQKEEQEEEKEEQSSPVRPVTGGAKSGRSIVDLNSEVIQKIEGEGSQDAGTRDACTDSAPKPKSASGKKLPPQSKSKGKGYEQYKDELDEVFGAPLEASQVAHLPTEQSLQKKVSGIMKDECAGSTSSRVSGGVKVHDDDGGAEATKKVPAMHAPLSTISRITEETEEGTDFDSAPSKSNYSHLSDSTAAALKSDADMSSLAEAPPKPAAGEKSGGLLGGLFQKKPSSNAVHPSTPDTPMDDSAAPPSPTKQSSAALSEEYTSRKKLSPYTDAKEEKQAWKAEAREMEKSLKVTASGPSANTIMRHLNKNGQLMMEAEEQLPEELDDVHKQMMMWSAFALAWDEVIDDLRRSDIICDRELAMLKFVRLDLGSRSHGLRPILLPTFFYAGQIRKVVDTGHVSTAQVMVLTELRMLAVWTGCQIGLLSGKHAHVITSTPFNASIVNVKHAMYRKKFYLSGIKIVEALENMCQLQQVPFDMRDFAEQLLTMLTSLEGEAYAIMKASQGKRDREEDRFLANVLIEVVQTMKKDVCKDPDYLKVLFKTSIQNSATASWKELGRVLRVLKRMLLATVAEATPNSEEAQRILGFFINSLGHPNLDKPPQMDKMASHSILTPCYEEDVLYPLESGALAEELGLKKKNITDLMTETDDSISLISYLKAMFPNDWSNFKERISTLVPELKADEISEKDFNPGFPLYEHRLQLQFWASNRGQLLARTVGGMMRYEKALRILALLEHPRPATMPEKDYNRWIDRLVSYKFEYVVTAQTYGKNRNSPDLKLRWLGESIDTLLQLNPRLKAAFIDNSNTEMGMTQFSVCIRGLNPKDEVNPMPSFIDDELQVYEVYRVRLPVNRYSQHGIFLGEGKPENQNHATIFAHGEALQAIDMNQDNQLCEAYKMRNLLTELQPSTSGKFRLFADDDDNVKIVHDTTASELLSVIRYRQLYSTETALVGFREYIFSDAAGALGKFAAATEYAFGTISQRIMTWPARIRLHYGHPDVFNKLFTISRGGISKATRLLHLTEDVFCGCSMLLRGGKIRYKEYINCGKGRDMGFDSINGFNFKISGGGGEWAISRESWRMGIRLDWFRLMSFYHGAVGFYINSWLTYCAVYFNIYAVLLFAWTESTVIGNDGTRIYNVQQVLQLGTLALIPYAGQLMLEMGVTQAILTLFQQIMTGSLLFYMFQQMTVAASFSADMSYGCGKYVGTGRGFNINTLEFVRVFTLYARSHLYMGFELLWILITLYIVRDCYDCDYGSITWSTWLLAFTLIIAPLWFNPFSFDMAKVEKNFTSWKQWMDGDVDFSTGTNWYTWNTAQLEKIRNDNGNNTDNWLNILGIFTGCLPYILMAIAAASRVNITLDALNKTPLANGYLVFILASSGILLLTVTTVVLRHHWLERANNKALRIYRWAISLGLLIFFLIFFIALKQFYWGNAPMAVSIIIYANINILIAVHKFSTAAFSQNNAIRAFCDVGYYAIDLTVGYTMFVLIALLAFLGLPAILQMRLLFNDSFAQMASYGKIAKAMKEAKIGFAPQSQLHAEPISRPGSAETAKTRGFEVRSMVKSEHRYM